MISSLIILSIVIYCLYDRKYIKLDLVDYNKSKKISKNRNVVISGKIIFDKMEAHDKELNIIFPTPLNVKIKSVSNYLGWKEETPQYIYNPGKIDGILLSEEFIGKLCTTPITHDSTYYAKDLSVAFYYYDDNSYSYFTKEDQVGFWRIRYLTTDLDFDKEYTFIGRIEDGKLYPSEDTNDFVIEGNYSKKDLENRNNKTKFLINKIIKILIIILIIVLVVDIIREKMISKNDNKVIKKESIESNIKNNVKTNIKDNVKNKKKSKKK